jgi:hypothetical protein
MIHPALVLAAVLSAAPVPAAAPPPAPAPATPADAWAPLRFLLGTWKTEAGGGKPGEAVSGGFTFALELDGRVAVRRSRSEYAPRPGETVGVRHEDLTVLFRDGDGLGATYWDNEGHVIRYAVRSEGDRVTFESVPGVPGPRFRLVYVRRGSDGVEVTFSIAPPGGDFQPYVSGLARRAGNPL